MKTWSYLLKYFYDAIGPFLGIFMGYAIVTWVLPPPRLLYRISDLVYRNGLPILIALIVIFLKHLLFPHAGDRTKVLRVVLPSIMLYLLLEWIIPFITQIPIIDNHYDSNIEFYGMGILALILWVVPFILIFIIGAKYGIQLGHRIRNLKVQNSNS
jgi:hypothetical protein